MKYPLAHIEYQIFSNDAITVEMMVNPVITQQLFNNLEMLYFLHESGKIDEQNNDNIGLAVYFGMEDQKISQYTIA